MKRTAALVATVVINVAGIAGALALHARENAAPAQPTWQQAVVTVNDRAMVDAATAWDAPFEVRYAEHNADIDVKRTELTGQVAGQAQPAVIGSVIVGCAVTIDTRYPETRAAFAHELGHCFGLMRHAMNPRSLMHVETGRPGVSAVDVTDADRAALATLYKEN